MGQGLRILDQLDSYKSEALNTMKATVRELTGQVERSGAYIELLGPGDEAKVPGSGVRTDTSMLRLP